MAPASASFLNFLAFFRVPALFSFTCAVFVLLVRLGHCLGPRGCLVLKCWCPSSSLVSISIAFLGAWSLDYCFLGGRFLLWSNFLCSRLFHSLLFGLALAFPVCVLLGVPGVAPATPSTSVLPASESCSFSSSAFFGVNIPSGPAGLFIAPGDKDRWCDQDVT